MNIPALCALFCLGTVLVWGGRYSAAIETATDLTLLHEDVTSPKIKNQFLSKFHTAKAAAVAGKKSLPIDPLAGSAARRLREGRPLTVAQKHAIAARMKALRQKILGSADSSLLKLAKRVDCSYPYPAASCKGHAQPKS